jgi:hypothetical protein
MARNQRSTRRRKMQSFIIALGAALSALAVSTAAVAAPGHILLIGMTDPATVDPVRSNGAPTVTAAVSRIPYSPPSLSKRNLVPPSLQKLDFHSAHAGQQLRGQGFGWTPVSK